MNSKSPKKGAHTMCATGYPGTEAGYSPSTGYTRSGNTDIYNAASPPII